MKILIAELRQKIIATLAQNFAEEQSNRVADYMLWADMPGERARATYNEAEESGMVKMDAVVLKELGYL